MAYSRCKWCGGKGCLSCDAQADADYKAQFPNGPKPLATFRTDDPEDLDRMKKAIGIEALVKAFSAGGRGVEEIEENCAKANAERKGNQ